MKQSQYRQYFKYYYKMSSMSSPNPFSQSLSQHLQQNESRMINQRFQEVQIVSRNSQVGINNEVESQIVIERSQQRQRISRSSQEGMNNQILNFFERVMQKTMQKIMNHQQQSSKMIMNHQQQSLKMIMKNQKETSEAIRGRIQRQPREKLELSDEKMKELGHKSDFVDRQVRRKKRLTQIQRGQLVTDYKQMLKEGMSPLNILNIIIGKFKITRDTTITILRKNHVNYPRKRRFLSQEN